MYFPLFLIFNDWAILALRVVLGGLLVTHGFPKVKNFRGTVASFANMRFKPGAFFVTAAIVVEFFGGIALILGIGTQIVAALGFFEFLILTGWKITTKQAFVGGWELEALIAAGELLLLTQGAGRFSVDHSVYIMNF